MIEVLVPSYNSSRFVDRFQQQIARLATGSYRVRVYDDASGDGSADELIARGFDVVRGAANLGPGGARNRLAELADGEWIHFHDIDDEIDPSYLGYVQPLLDDNVDVLIHYVKFVDEVTREAIIDFKYTHLIERDPVGSLLVQPMGTLSTVIRRSKFLEIGGFDENFRCYEDGDLHLRLALAGARFRGIPEFLATSLRHSNGASSNMRYCHECRLKFLERYVGILPERCFPDLAQEFRKTAYALLTEGDIAGAKRSLYMCRKVGGVFPQTNSVALKLISSFLPDMSILRLQEGFRKLSGLWQSQV